MKTALLSISRPSEGGLLRFYPRRAFSYSRFWPSIFQIATVLGLVLVLYFAFFGTIRPARNFATVVTWTLWWPLLPWSFLFLGRAWCAICPLGAIGHWAQGLGARLGLAAGRQPGAWLKRYGVWLMVFTFAALAWVDRTFSIIGSPRATGVLLLILMLGALLMSLLYRQRAWCRYLCPLGALSGIYATTAAVELRADKAICQTCRTKACYASCPLYEFPQTMDSNRNCNLCGNCLKSCQHGAIALAPRPPGQELWLFRHSLVAESTLAVLMVALVYLQTIDMTLPWGDYMKAVVENTPLVGYNAAFTATFGAVIALGLGSYLVAAWASGRLSGVGLATIFARFGYAYIPLALSGHLGHNFSHLLLEGPRAIQTALNQLGIPISLVPEALTDAPPDFSTVTVLTIMVLVIGIGASAYVLWRIVKREGRAAITAWPHFALLGFFSLAYLVMFLLPMNPRHGH
ncbi:MAG: 4Fe-4S binding protein [Chloroflexi bacterium]|nr:4Fe-4S binding protein [Chloroflexota bacterium]